MKTFKAYIVENKEKDKKEYDYEGEMVKSDLRSIMANAERIIDLLKDDDNLPEWCQNKITLAEDYVSTVANYLTAEMNEEVKKLEEKGPGLWANIRAKKARGERMRKPGEKGAPTEAQLKSARNEEYEADDEALREDSAAWQRKEGKSESGGLNRKGIESYRRENPGSKLSMAVTTKPSKLKSGSKAANRRKSFCARMGGMKKRLTSAKTARDPDSRINKALRKWNC